MWDAQDAVGDDSGRVWLASWTASGTKRPFATKVEVLVAVGERRAGPIAMRSRRL